MYVKITNGQIDQYPYTVGNLRRDNPQTSFPRTIPAETLAEYGVYPVTVLDRPSVTSAQVADRQSEPSLVDGVWTLGWTVRNKTQAELDALAATERSKRDGLLAKSDWTQVADAPVDKAAWATYRQALRDVPAQSGFPTTISWPSAPV